MVTRFLGSGFGGKLLPWATLRDDRVVAARKLGRPAKLKRRAAHDVFECRLSATHRTAHQLGASKDGKLLALKQDYSPMCLRCWTTTTRAVARRLLTYSVANLEVTSGIVHRNVGAPMYMRGPGAVPGLFALEAGMNELAVTNGKWILSSCVC